MCLILSFRRRRPESYALIGEANHIARATDMISPSSKQQKIKNFIQGKSRLPIIQLCFFLDDIADFSVFDFAFEPRNNVEI